MFVDSHCHLNYKGLVEDQAGVLGRARAAGVDTMLNIATRESEWDAVLATAMREPDVWATVGIHPHEADEHPDVDTAKLIARSQNPRIVAIGETGLDYYYEHSPRAPQQANFRSHIAAARQTGLPVIVHTRDADDDTIAILQDEMGKGTFTGLIHCFTGTQRLADAALEMGLSISVSGIATFKNSQSLRDVIKSVPLERLLVETDAPFLAPVPHRGKTNEPAFVVHTANMLAELKGVTGEELAKVTTENFFRLFSKVQRPA
jgi:TatD DNase family protein